MIASSPEQFTSQLGLDNISILYCIVIWDKISWQILGIIISWLAEAYETSLGDRVFSCIGQALCQPSFTGVHLSAHYLQKLSQTARSGLKSCSQNWELEVTHHSYNMSCHLGVFFPIGTPTGCDTRGEATSLIPSSISMVEIVTSFRPIFHL